MAGVILHGSRNSPYVKRVEMALKIKDIFFEFVEEDLKHKRALLLKYNPVHKKIPVLVHNGNPLAESLVILEYIDEAWKTRPRLLPEDPYRQSQVRFWANFLHQQLFEAIALVIKTSCEAQQKAIGEMYNKQKLLEDGMQDLLLDGIPLVVDNNINNVGLLDVLMFSIFDSYEAHEQVLGIKVIDSDKTPVLHSWIKAINELHVVKELHIPHENRTWTSPYAKRVELALKVKDIPYEYVEEDLRNKSPMLLKLNPIHKKVPVLVHNGKAITESLVIIEYIDETWRNGPQLLPKDPYKRSEIRFWSSYIQQVSEAMIMMLKTDGEAQEKAIKDVTEKLKLLEAGLEGLFPNGIASADEYIKTVTVLDLVMVENLGGFKYQEEVLGVQVIDCEKTPLVFSCLTALAELPAVKKSQMPWEKVVAFLKLFRENALKSSASI